MIRVGPAGWSYSDWEGIVYPRPKPSGFHPLSFLAQFFQCVEINSTFYAPARREHAARWVREVESTPEFRFTAKLHRDFTHSDQQVSVGSLRPTAQHFLEGLEPLRAAGKLAALLVQFPVSFRASMAGLRRLQNIRSLFGDQALVLEVRHRSWFTPPALAEIGELGYSLAHIDLPGAREHPPEWHEPTGPIGYLRLHGRNSETWFARDSGRDQRYDYLYGREEVAQLAARASRIAQEHRETFVVTNNHFSGKAVANGLELLASLREAQVAAPAGLLRTYPELSSSTFPAAVPPASNEQQELF